ncbi:hypothetical protein [Flavobacterium franklandianum]|uniref:Uncharacterized protein n=1 Tax=Flavobacterium franklandianum TaxID=2594430 RepID=A0A553CNA9_9FLAO|nr:hypothetical protein [Flavobacterium franklandianum]TRX22026.1 hypothetical protein FNW17_04965 [Flavobacterium franklandianum]
MGDSIFLNKNDFDKKFENIIFPNFILEKNISTEGDILFNNCTFKSTFILENLKARELFFFKCNFEEKFILSSSFFNIGGFTDCIFSGEINLTSNKCTSNFVLRNVRGKEFEINGEYQTLQIVSSKIGNLILKDINTERLYRESKIEFLVENEINKIQIKSYITLSNIVFVGGDYKSVFFEGVFEESINFKKKVKIENLYLESSTFKKRIDFEEGEYEYISFYRSIFQSLVLISDNNLTEDIPRDLKIKELTFHSCVFDMNVSVGMEDIQFLNLSNNNFKQIFNFNNNADNNNENSEVTIRINGTNQGNIIIERVDADVNLSDINYGNILFKDLNISTLNICEFQNVGNVTFSNIKSGYYFTIQDSITGNLNFINFDINIFKEIVIAQSSLNGIIFNKYPNKILSYSKNSIVGYGIKEKSKSSSNLKNIYNQLKHIARGKGDIDVSNKYQSLEYKQLLLSKEFGFDTFILLLNWLSNDNGRSWFRGVIFTLSIAFLFFLLYFHFIGIVFCFEDHFKDYIIFITSFPKLELETYSCENNYWEVKLIIFVARIFVSYGIYQTITAFRKYAKG